jgi:hypothetical protein
MQQDGASHEAEYLTTKSHRLVPIVGSSKNGVVPRLVRARTSRFCAVRKGKGRRQRWGSRVLTGSGGLPEDGLALLVVGLLDHVQQQQLVAGAQQVVRGPPQRRPATLREVHRQPHPPLARAARRRRHATLLSRELSTSSPQRLQGEGGGGMQVQEDFSIYSAPIFKLSTLLIFCVGLVVHLI